jgi:hypothetical protein
MNILVGLGMAFGVVGLSTITGRLIFKTWYSGGYGIGELLLCYFPFVIVGVAVVICLSPDGTISFWPMANMPPISLHNLIGLPCMDVNCWAFGIPLVLYPLPGMLTIVD